MHNTRIVIVHQLFSPSHQNLVCCTDSTAVKAVLSAAPKCHIVERNDTVACHFESLADTDTMDTHIQPLTSFHLANSTTPYRDFTLCPVSQRLDKKHRLYFSPRVTDTARQTQLLRRSHSKSWNDSTDCFNGTYSIVCMPLGVVDCISLAACQPAGHRWHPHLDVSTQASWRQAFFPRLSAVSAKLQGSCFFCSSIFWLRQCCEKGGRSGGYGERPRGGWWEKKKKNNNIWAHQSLFRTLGH